MFCKQCGAEILDPTLKKCPKCNTTVGKGGRFCEFCGRPKKDPHKPCECQIQKQNVQQPSVQSQNQNAPTQQMPVVNMPVNNNLSQNANQNYNQPAVQNIPVAKDVPVNNTNGPAVTTETWTCSCGTTNNTPFCSNCGAKRENVLKPVLNNSNNYGLNLEKSNVVRKKGVIEKYEKHYNSVLENNANEENVKDEESSEKKEIELTNPLYAQIAAQKDRQSIVDIVGEQVISDIINTSQNNNSNYTSGNISSHDVNKPNTVNNPSVVNKPNNIDKPNSTNNIKTSDNANKHNNTQNPIKNPNITPIPNNAHYSNNDIVNNSDSFANKENIKKQDNLNNTYPIENQNSYENQQNINNDNKSSVNDLFPNAFNEENFKVPEPQMPGFNNKKKRPKQPMNNMGNNSPVPRAPVANGPGTAVVMPANLERMPAPEQMVKKKEKKYIEFFGMASFMLALLSFYQIDKMYMFGLMGASGLFALIDAIFSKKKYGIGIIIGLIAKIAIYFIQQGGF